MSLNTAHLNGGVLIHNGEIILVYSDHTTVEWSGQDAPPFKGAKHGRIYLTTHRVIFNSKNSSDAMQSFSFPFVTLSDVELEQPIFGANYIKGKVRAQPNGNWAGEAKFKILFKHGGAIEFGQAMLKAAHLATRMANQREAPPPYVPPESQWYQAPPPAYAPPPQGYYGWMPPSQAFPDQPPANSVFMTDAPPPYPGINSMQPGGPPDRTAPPAGFHYPPQQGNAAGPAPGFSAGDAKAAEAAQSAYYDPNRPQMAYVPPPSYYEHPPTYDEATHKKQQ
ncbi:WW domain-binding protein 2 [Atheta coriaria]|uniref:WW domain-binding protein 2 n=1 Tax=Dalotia coriaria TaxID=877792 RepID=UPI0031F40833